MHLTAAHISPIVALLAGILILIAPAVDENTFAKAVFNCDQWGATAMIIAAAIPAARRTRSVEDAPASSFANRLEWSST
jgi:hypothetical protein